VNPTRHGAPVLALLLSACAWITEDERVARWDVDGDGVERPQDCDDSDPDRSELLRFHPDADGDGFGDPTQALEACAAPAGAVADGTDCDDADNTRFPGAVERCNDVDDDCDRSVDEDAPVIVFYLDADGDGAGDPDVRVEACTRPADHVAVGDDCDDDDDARYPGAPEVCNGIDDDCDDDVDTDDIDLDPASAQQYRDEDGDGFGLETDPRQSCEIEPGWVRAFGDCDDDDDARYPGAPERCDGIDQDCDKAIDEDAVDATRYYPDDDGDGFGDLTRPLDACVAPPEHVQNGGDCDDDRGASNPLADEVCDNLEDDDCDNTVDEPECDPAAHTGDTGP
jgi:hypothetical protein